MSLQRKFAVLLLLSALVVVFSLGTAYQFGAVLERELVWPFETLTRIRKETSELERIIGMQQDLLIPIRASTSSEAEPLPSPSREARVTRYEELTAEFNVHLDALRLIPRLEQIAGAATVRNLIERSTRVNNIAQFWLASDSGENAQTVRTSLSEILALLHRMDEQFLESSQHALA